VKNRQYKPKIQLGSFEEEKKTARIEHKSIDLHIIQIPHLDCMPDREPYNLLKTEEDHTKTKGRT
jgi:hypothetical protein